ncbi:MAG: Zn-ribbon containing protein [Candidatus Pacearchaeota archaeon]
MAHRCVHCGKIIEKASEEILKGCSNCGSKFFFYIRDEKILEFKNNEKKIISIPEEEKKEIEKEAREILGIVEEDQPVILDLESIRILGKGKFEIDLVSLINRRPIVIKINEGKYVIDLS